MLINANLTDINASSVVVVANERQVLAFKNTYYLQKGNVQLPKVLSWQRYLQHTYAILCPHSNLRCINLLESRYLISKSLTQSGQKQHQQLVDEVIKNYDYCRKYLISFSELSATKILASKVFCDWIKTYKNTKLKLGLIDIHDLVDLIINSNTIATKPIIYGFKTLTPQQKLLLDLVGYTQIQATKTNNTSFLSFVDTYQEIKTVASWAKNLVDANPNQSIVIVCPTLDESQSQVKSIFNQVFDTLLVETGKKPYNVSLGLPLSSYPLVQDLLAILTLSEQIKKDQIQSCLFIQVIKSVYVGGYNKERSVRSILINQILELSIERLPFNKAKILLTSCPVLLKIINKIHLQTTMVDTLESHLLNFNETLNIWEFMIDRSLNSNEYQLFNKCLKSNLSLNQFSLYCEKVNVYDAIQVLKELTTQVIFQAQNTKAKVQVLGSLEAQGLYFDHAWVLGMTNQFLPEKLNNPSFIPHTLSTKQQISNSSYSLIKINTNSTLDDLSSLAENVVFSYAKEHLENEQLPSPLFSIKAKDQTVLSQTIKPIKHEEEINDSMGGRIYDTKVHSGVAILKDQMSCAFKGFSHRLGIQDFQAPHVGISKMEQGSIVHKALEYIYQKINSKDKLLVLDDNALKKLIQNKIDLALKGYPSSRFKVIEKIRLEKLINEFIKIDKQRGNFKVLATEKHVDVNIAGLQFSTKLDRLDQVSNGDTIIFDYKMSKVSTSSWFGDAINEPQLPIYIISNDSKGAAFIKLNSNNVSIEGLSKNQDNLPKQIKTHSISWDEQVTLWGETLECASSDFQNGKAEVLPRKQACNYCHLSLLCRVEK